MELKIENNELILGNRKVILTDEQLKELGIKPSPFDIEDGDRVYYIDALMYGIEDFYYSDSSEEDVELLHTGKICKDEDLMEQKALHQNLNDLLWKFTIENGWSDDLWEDFDKYKYFIKYDKEDKEFIIECNAVCKYQGVICFISEKIAQRAIDEIVKPYMKEHPEFVW